MTIFKRRGSVPSLTTNRRRERALVAEIEARVDAGLERRGLLDATIHRLDALASAHPRDASWRFCLGRLLMACGDPLEARAELEAAAVLDRRDPRIAAHLAIWYEAAFFASRGDLTNRDLLPLAGPSLCANARRFAQLDEVAPAATLAARAAEWAGTALRFRLVDEDRAFLLRIQATAKTQSGPAASPGSELQLIPSRA